MAKEIGYATMESPIGPLLLASTEEGLCYIDFADEEEGLPNLVRWCQKTLPGVTPVKNEAVNEQAKLQLVQYFAGERTEFDVPTVLYGTPFQKTVWNELTNIPFGETRSYKDIAIAIGTPKAVRAIGGANNRNPIPVIIPCHRVVGSNGALVGYGGGLSIKQYLLAHEEGPLFANATSNQAVR
ncbi:methylated-DNA--[protein]-cysteine S-methyltransferase [Brevibacillus gelatini]|uniref:Methylated-DNA--protein-cysteine methyltransferase n=1 Tax=Brevibacillus gelatini TaxID=1655277 RepID=A0A3M8AXU9_9BACL|nr:methylated-DNA--[protein]-cysteine S-methyltransferase [Brevibacillus gelatini]RNB55445.1 methylated-DNA--[protein]-cysteine S-methyltransferase [Brevibacillus gelatini]